MTQKETLWPLVTQRASAFILLLEDPLWKELQSLPSVPILGTEAVGEPFEVLLGRSLTMAKDKEMDFRKESDIGHDKEDTDHLQETSNLFFVPPTVFDVVN